MAVIIDSGQWQVEHWRSSTSCLWTMQSDLKTFDGCLQLLEISGNLKLLLEILEVAWNLVDAAGKFCD